MTSMLRVGVMTLAVGLPQLAETPGVDSKRLMRDVTVLSSADFEGRAAGSPGGVKARRWIVDQFRGLKSLEPLSSTGFEQPFTFDGVSAANVVGRLRGRRQGARSLVVTAHYDHLGIRGGDVYHGADDNASGVAALLAAARYFAASPPRHALIFAALDAEERGQRGARALLQWNRFPRHDVALNVNLDMLSRSASHELFVAGTSYSPSLRGTLRPVVERSPISVRFGHDRAESEQEDWTRSSDHAPFHDAGIPFLYFGVEDHPDYHRPSDRAEQIDPQFFTAAVTTVVDAIIVIDRSLP